MMRRQETIEPRRSRILVSALVWSILMLSAAAILTAVFGGFSTEIMGLGLSVRQPWRVLLIAAICFGILWRPGSRASARRGFERSRRAMERASPAIALIASAATFAVGMKWGTFIAGGSDSYGYVSQAHLWSRGRLIVSEPLAIDAPWRNAEESFSPVGYRSGRRPGAIVPAYPPGLPLLMAGALLLGGSQAVYWVVPFMGAAGVMLAFLVGRVLLGSFPSLLAALWLAASPVFLYQLVQPMSDVPALTAWLAALFFALRARRCSPLLCGLTVSMAVLIRPNLIVLTIPVGALLIVTHRPRCRPRTALLAFAVGLAPGLAFLGILQRLLYGSCLATGYGDPRALFHLSHVPRNVVNYTRWLIETESPFVLAAPLTLWKPSRRAVILALLAFVLIGFSSYLVYLVFDVWWYLRFLLPVLPMLLIFNCGAFDRVARRVAPFASILPLLMLGVLLVALGLNKARALNVFTLHEDEKRYEDVGRYVARALPEKAALFSKQESGALRFYGDRLTLRWDVIEPARFDHAVSWLVARGFSPYLVIENWERKEFAERFTGRSALADLDWPAVAMRPGGRIVHIYDLREQARSEKKRDAQTEFILQARSSER